MKERACRSPFLSDSSPAAAREIGIAIMNLDNSLFLEINHDQSQSCGHHAAASCQPIDHSERLVLNIVVGSDRLLVPARNPFDIMFVKHAQTTEDRARPLRIVTAGIEEKILHALRAMAAGGGDDLQTMSRSDKTHRTGSIDHIESKHIG